MAVKDLLDTEAARKNRPGAKEAMPLQAEKPK